MKEYPKIETLYDRDEKTFKVIEGKWRLPEFEYLAKNDWLFTEKVDGTNVRVMWDGKVVRYGGRSDNAQMPLFLLAKLFAMFSEERLASVFLTASESEPVCLYGEGYGAKIQKGGGNYKPDGVDFVLFDVLVGSWWLKHTDVKDVATKLSVQVVPLIGHGTLAEATSLVRAGVASEWGAFQAEGLVLRPSTDLYTRAGHRIIAKLKTKDF